MSQEIDIQGHRGCRGLMPENTIEAFIHALELGVNTLEMDVCISKDHKVIVSHEPYFNAEFCLKPDGSNISLAEQKTFNLYSLSADEIKSFDTGTKYFEKFPNQRKIKTYKPELSEVVAAANSNTKADGERTINYNIEIKRRMEWDNIFHPDYKTFADLVIEEIERLKIINNTTVQCFDLPTLMYLNEQYPNIRLVYLISNKKSLKKNLKKLGFKPYIYSPNYKLVTKKLVKSCRKRNILVVPWTVNSVSGMEKMIRKGVDGIITDYPNKLTALNIH